MIQNIKVFLAVVSCVAERVGESVPQAFIISN